MHTGVDGKTTFLTEGTKGLITACGLLLGACVLGSAVILAAGGDDLQTLGIGVFALVALGAVGCIALDIPLIAVVRFAFIASFFFKGELNLFKIDEIEDPSGFNLSLTFLTAVILLVHDRLTAKYEEKLLPGYYSFLLAGLFLCAAISVIYGGSETLGWFSLWSLFSSILITLAIASHFGQRDRLIQLIVGTAIGLLFTGAVALSQYMLDFPTDLALFGTGTEKEKLGTQSEVFSRVPAFLRTPNGMAWVVSSLVPLVIAPLICRVKAFTSSQKFLLTVAAFAGTVAVILSLARGSWIGFLAAMVLLALFGWYRLSTIERRSYAFTVGGAAILSCLLLLPFSGRIYERLTEDDQGAAAIRMPMMENASLMIENNPLTGVGLNGYRANMTKYDETGMFVSQVFRNPVHNIFAHVTAEVGIPGGILFCLLILAAMYECFRTMRSHDRLLFALAFGASVGFIAFIISGMKEPGSLGSVRPPVHTCFFLFGTALALSRTHRRAMN